jgi:hypothetical protein
MITLDPIGDWVARPCSTPGCTGAIYVHVGAADGPHYCNPCTKERITMAKAKKTAKKSKAHAAPTKTTKGPKMTLGENPRIVDPRSNEGRREKIGKAHTKDVMVDANIEETATIAHELCSVLDEESRVKEKRRESNAGFREKLAGLDDRKKKLSECVRSNRKLEPVRVQEWLVGTEVEICRIDTGEIVERRTATTDDLQAELPAEGLHDKRAHSQLTDPAPAPREDDGEE